MSTHDLIDLLLKAVAGIIAITGFLAGLKQYKRAQSWKRSEAILNLIDAFKNDAKVQAACLMLDWDRRTIQVDKDTKFSFENKMLISGLRILWMNEPEKVPLDAVAPASEVEAGNMAFTPEEALIRDCFDAFFDYFDKVNAFRRGALVAMADLRYFNYWLESVRKVGDYKSDPVIQTTIDTYVEVYDFSGFREMTTAYKEHAKTLFRSDSGQEKTAAVSMSS